MAGILQPYVGKYCSAESASSKLDIDSILAGCDAVDEEASSIGNYANQLSETSGRINASALSVNGKTISGTAQEYCDGINGVEAQITSVTSQIREIAISVYNQLQQELNNQAIENDKPPAAE